MATRRIGGWWRLWIALSAVWVALAITIGMIAAFEGRSAGSQRESTIEWSCEGYAGQFKIDLRDRSVADLIASKYTGSPMPLSTVDIIDRCIKAKSRDYEKEVSDRRLVTAAGTAAGAVGPPLILLILGALVGWIVRGFRSSRSGQ